MSYEQGVAEILLEDTLEVLNKKICIELNKILSKKKIDEKGELYSVDPVDDILDRVLSEGFKNPYNEKYDDVIFEIIVHSCISKMLSYQSEEMKIAPTEGEEAEEDVELLRDQDERFSKGNR